MLARATRGIRPFLRRRRRRAFHVALVPRQQAHAADTAATKPTTEAATATAAAAAPQQQQSVDSAAALQAEASSAAAPKRSLAKTIALGAAAGAAALAGIVLYQSATDGEFRRDCADLAPAVLDNADALLAVAGVDGSAAEADMAPRRAFVGDVIAAQQPVLLTLASGAVHSVDADAADGWDAVGAKLVAQCPAAEGDPVVDIRFVDAADAVPRNHAGPLAPDLVRQLRARSVAPRTPTLVGPPSSAGAGELRHALGRARVHEARVRGEIRRKAAARARAKRNGRSPLDADYPFALSVEAHNNAVDELTEVMRVQEILAARVRAVEGGFGR